MKPSPPFPVRDVVLVPGLVPIFLHGCEIKSGSVLGTRLRVSIVDGSVVCGCMSGQEGIHC